MQVPTIYDDFTGREITDAAKQVRVILDETEPSTFDISEPGFRALLEMKAGRIGAYREHLEAIMAVARPHPRMPSDVEIRMWAQGRGMEVNTRGPVSDRIRNAYKTAFDLNNIFISPCFIHPGQIHDVFYVVKGVEGVKLGITSGNGESRLRTHEVGGYSEVSFIRWNLNPGIACMAEQRIVYEIKRETSFRSNRGREYFPCDALEVILSKAKEYLPGNNDDTEVS
jgi:hypothetical protein